MNDEIENTSMNQSLDLVVPQTKKKTNKSTKKSDDTDNALELKNKTTFVPGRGQKTIFNKLKKIKGSFHSKSNKNPQVSPLICFPLLDSIAVPNEVEPVVSKSKSKAAKSSRQKRVPRRCHHTIDSSDDDTFESNRRPPPRPTMPAYVNLDSDDEYAETPISITRNLATASAPLQTSENDEMRVLVKFGSQLDEYMMRPVRNKEKKIFLHFM